MQKMTVSVEDLKDQGKAWGATLINVLQVDGVWMAVVWDNYYDEIYVVEASLLHQWNM
jgi:hypothetical protein